MDLRAEESRSRYQKQNNHILRTSNINWKTHQAFMKQQIIRLLLWLVLQRFCYLYVHSYVSLCIFIFPYKCERGEIHKKTLIENLPHGMPWKWMNEWWMNTVSGFRFFLLIQAYLRTALSLKWVFVHNSGVETTGRGNSLNMHPQKEKFL